MHVNVDRNFCENHGQCELVAPSVFWLDENGTLQYHSNVEESLRDDVEQAADLCPVQAIQVQD
jgi:ferredoxin